MMPTIFFLLFAILPIACLMEQENLPHGCVPVRFVSFLPTGNKTRLPNVLGQYCSSYYIKQNLTGQWIGIAASRIKSCKVCCVRQDENKALHYNETRAPNQFPCGKGKICKKGRCVTK
uniref:Putative ixostatin n=1 Tax=Ixodes ricinus TaxID=34613 RepID=A0A0K8RIR1_IXORI